MAVTRHSSFDITVSTIADRNALLRKVNHMTVLVRDAIADINAGAGKATYRYDAYDDTWILVSRSKTDTISFDTEELTIVNGKVTPANIILDNQVWGLAIIQNDQIFIEPRMSDLIIDYTGISGLDDYNGMTLKFTYAYGSQAGQVSSIIQDAVNTVETELALKANSADVYTKSQVDSKIVELAPATDISGKADITYVDTELALKADKSNVYTKIESDSLLSDKASTTYVDSGLNIIHTQIDNVIVGNDIMPKVSGISNIGSATNKFGAIYTKEMHIDANTLYVDGVPVLGSSANTINISADINQGIRVATKGTGQTVLDSESSTVIKTNGINADVLIESQGTGSRSRITSDSSVIITAPVISLEGSISGSSTSDLTFRNITATGNLTVQGSTTFVDSTNVNIKDNIIVVNKGELGTGVSLGYAGIQIDRGDDADSRIVWNEASDKFIMGILGSEKNIASEDFVTSAINAIPSVDFSGYYTKAQIDTSLGNKVDKISGKGLSTEDYTTAEKTKLSGIEVNANNYILPVASSTVLGGVKAGTNISIDANGVISANDTSIAWSEITSKPTTLSGYGITDAALSTHNHSGVYEPAITAGTAGQYLRGDKTWAPMPTSLPASDVYSWAKASTKPSYSYSEVGSPSTTGNGASGTWGINITGSSASCSGNSATATTATNQTAAGGTTCDDKFKNTPAHGTSFSECHGVSDAPNTGWWLIYSIRHSNSSNYWGTQIAYGWEDNANAIYQRNISAGTWSGWTRVDVSGANITEIVNNAGYITSAGRAYPRRSDGGDLNFYWSGQGGQPNWLWGGNDGTNMYVYNPSNFSVNYANSAGSANSVSASAVASGTAGLGAGGIGTYGFFYSYDSASTGTNVSGSRLRWTSATSGSNGYGTPTGTWKSMGYAGESSTLFLRIA